jgi:hypothetical protein
MWQRISFFLIALIFQYVCGHGQCLNTEKKDSTNIYLLSLMEYCSQYLNQNSNTSIVLVEKNYFISDGFPDEINGFRIRYLDSWEIRKELKGKKAITVVRIVPLRIEGDNFYVNVIPFSVSYSKRNFSYVNGGGLGVSFQYDSERKCIKFKESKRGSI